jgi:hypothetical protein
VQEAKPFQQAFVAADSAGEPMLDDLAVAERLQRQTTAIASGTLANPTIRRFGEITDRNGR